MSARTLVLGDPVVALGQHGVIADGAVIVADHTVEAVGTRTELERRGFTFITVE